MDLEEKFPFGPRVTTLHMGTVITFFYCYKECVGILLQGKMSALVQHILFSIGSPNVPLFKTVTQFLKPIVGSL